MRVNEASKSRDSVRITPTMSCQQQKGEDWSCPPGKWRRSDRCRGLKDLRELSVTVMCDGRGSYAVVDNNGPLDVEKSCKSFFTCCSARTEATRPSSLHPQLAAIKLSSRGPLSQMWSWKRWKRDSGLAVLAVPNSACVRLFQAHEAQAQVHQAMLDWMRRGGFHETQADTFAFVCPRELPWLRL